MRWGDERYVKLYTRDTLTTQMLGWEGRSVLWELFRKVDRAGIVEIGDLDPVAALAALTGIPEDICRVAWGRLSSGKDPIVTLCDRRDGEPARLLILNFLLAQEARQSDKARQQKHRELARAGLLVTSRDTDSRNVDEGHAESHGVTLSCTETRQDELRKEARTDDADAAEGEKGLRLTASDRTGEPVAASNSQPEPWPQDLLEQLRVALGRQLETNDQEMGGLDR